MELASRRHAGAKPARLTGSVATSLASPHTGHGRSFSTRIGPLWTSGCDKSHSQDVRGFLALRQRAAATTPSRYTWLPVSEHENVLNIGRRGSIW